MDVNTGRIYHFKNDDELINIQKNLKDLIELGKSQPESDSKEDIEIAEAKDGKKILKIIDEWISIQNSNMTIDWRIENKLNLIFALLTLKYHI